ncbi:MAG: hypothetical protein KHZ62_08970 [Clostridiales bacterium]|nr:hypothetical protein [Clostridiales bacterium]
MDMLTCVDLRKSVRNFTDRLIEEESLQQLKNFFQNNDPLEDEIQTRIELVKREELPKGIEEIGGYHGFFIQAPYYILIYSDKRPNFIENAGYLGERVILKMTEMGIDSCWLTLKEERVLEQKEGQLRLTGLIAAGYGGEFKNIKVVNEMIWGKGYDNLKIHQLETDNDIRMEISDMIFMKTYGQPITFDELESSGIAEGLYAARRAPSAMNQQPWRFILDGDKVVLVIKKNEYTNIYEAKIAAGAAMYHFAAVISERLFPVKWKMGNLEQDYHIPQDCAVVAYCPI